MQRNPSKLPCLCCARAPSLYSLKDLLHMAVAPMCTGAINSMGPACAPRCSTMPETLLKSVYIVHMPQLALQNTFPDIHRAQGLGGSFSHVHSSV